MFAKGDLVHVPQDSIMYGLSTHSPASIKINPSPALGIFVEACPDEKTGKVMMSDGLWLIKLKQIYLNKSEYKC